MGTWIALPISETPVDRPQMDLMAHLGAFFCPSVNFGLSERKHQNDPS